MGWTMLLAGTADSFRVQRQIHLVYEDFDKPLRPARSTVKYFSTSKSQPQDKFPDANEFAVDEMEVLS